MKNKKDNKQKHRETKRARRTSINKMNLGEKKNYNNKESNNNT